MDKSVGAAPLPQLILTLLRSCGPACGGQLAESAAVTPQNIYKTVVVNVWKTNHLNE
jgi:hypothetical protein